MNLIALDMWSLFLIFIGLAVLGLANRLVWALARGTERFIISIAQGGAFGLARSVLAVLVGYTEDTYRKSRFVRWNQVQYRLALLWGAFLLLAMILGVLHLDNRVDSVFTIWLVFAVAYVGFRSLVCWNRSPSSSAQTRRDGQSFNPQVKDRNWPHYRQSPTLIRHWDYLDELFAHTK